MLNTIYLLAIINTIKMVLNFTFKVSTRFVQTVYDILFVYLLSYCLQFLIINTVFKI